MAVRRPPKQLCCLLVLLGAALIPAGCRDTTTTGPAAVTRPAPLGADLVQSLVTLGDACTSLSTATVSKTIGPSGGIVAVGPDTLKIPGGALKQAVTIQASLPAGSLVNIVVFGPDGLHFNKAASLTMGYANCSLLPSATVQIAQVTDDLQIIQYLPSTKNKKAKTVTAVVQHFTNYAVAW